MMREKKHLVRKIFEHPNVEFFEQLDKDIEERMRKGFISMDFSLFETKYENSFGMIKSVLNTYGYTVHQFGPWNGRICW